MRLMRLTVERHRETCREMPSLNSQPNRCRPRTETIVDVIYEIPGRAPTKWVRYREARDLSDLGIIQGRRTSGDVR